jgi:hypothetical protein
MVVFDPDEALEAIMACRASSEITTLTEFFHMNLATGYKGDVARTLTYQEFPHKFVCHKDDKTWSFRKQGFALGRLDFVPPTAGERFYLRTLLTVVRGPRSDLGRVSYCLSQIAPYRSKVVQRLHSILYFKTSCCARIIRVVFLSIFDLCVVASNTSLLHLLFFMPPLLPCNRLARHHHQSVHRVSWLVIFSHTVLNLHSSMKEDKATMRSKASVRQGVRRLIWYKRLLAISSEFILHHNNFSHS